MIKRTDKPIKTYFYITKGSASGLYKVMCENTYKEPFYKKNKTVKTVYEPGFKTLEEAEAYKAQKEDALLKRYEQWEKVV